MFLDRNKDEKSTEATFEYSKTDHSFCIGPEMFEIFEIAPGSSRKNFFAFFLQTIIPDRKRLLRMVRLSISEWCDNDFIYKIKTPGGTTKQIRLMMQIEGTHLKGTVQNITHYRLIDDHLRILSLALQQNPNMIAIADTKGRIKYINKTYTDVTGYTLDDLYDKSFTLLSAGKQSAEFYAQMWETLKKGEVWHGEFVNRKKNGTEYYSGAHIFPIRDETGDIDYYVTTEKDITLQKKRQEANLIQEKEAQMGEMISMIAHQWRQPLSSIGTIAALLKVSLDLGETDNRKMYEGIDKINSYVQFLSNTVNGFRNFFNPNKHKEVVDIGEVIRETASIIEKTFEAKGITFVMECGEEIYVHIHKNEMMQVVLNLLKNAQDALGEKHISHPKVIIRTAKIGKKVIIEVVDNAGGIPADIKHRIFDPYFSTKSEKVGTGLGLHMSKIITEQHNGGIIGVDNTESGALFRITLPYYEQTIEEKIND